MRGAGGPDSPAAGKKAPSAAPEPSSVTGEATTLDAMTLSVIEAGLSQVCDEMDLAFSRAAFSPVIAEANDRSDGIYSAEDGALIAQGLGGLPVFVGVMQYSTGRLIEMIRDGECLPPEPGDVYIVNDPYLGGTHLMDVRFARPVWRGGRIWCWLSNTGHWPDIGGGVPGGFSASAAAVGQEGNGEGGDASRRSGRGPRHARGRARGRRRSGGGPAPGHVPSGRRRGARRCACRSR